MDFLGQCVAQSHSDTTFGLKRDAFGIDDKAEVLRADYTLDLYGSGALVDCDLREESDGNTYVVAASYPVAASAGTFGRRPAELIRPGIEDRKELSVFYIPKAKIQRIYSRMGGHQVDVRFSRKTVGVVVGPAPWACFQKMRLLTILQSVVPGNAIIWNVVEQLGPASAHTVEGVIPLDDLARSIDT